jgi:hypothetical protein
MKRAVQWGSVVTSTTWKKVRSLHAHARVPCQIKRGWRFLLEGSGVLPLGIAFGAVSQHEEQPRNEAQQGRERLSLTMLTRSSQNSPRMPTLKTTVTG